MTEAIPAALVAILDALFPPGVWLASHPDTARVLGISDKTLKAMGDDSRIRYRLRGTTWRVYAREDIEAYVRCPPAHLKARQSTTNVSRPQAVAASARPHGGFTAARARERAARLEKMRGE